MSLRSDDDANCPIPLPGCGDALARTDTPDLPDLTFLRHHPRATMSVELTSSPVPGSDFYQDIVSGLEKSPPTIASKYLYDDRGSRLFHQICDLPEYYPTRTELTLTRRHASDLAAQVGSRAQLIELGVGRGVKTRILLDELHDLAAYVPIDISPQELHRCVHCLRAQFPDIQIRPLCADYNEDFTLPDISFEGRTVFYYPGSTIGNFTPHIASQFLQRLSRYAGPRGALIVGVDLEKDPQILHAAYNDAGGITAEFNLNLLRRINRECRADFDLQKFRHRAVYQEDNKRIEMRLVSTHSQTVHFPDRTFHFDEGDFLVTEHSYKYTIEDFALLCEESGWRTRSLWSDRDALFSLWYLETATIH